MEEESTQKYPIYDTPLPRRYNPYGEWRPLMCLPEVNIDDVIKKVNFVGKKIKIRELLGF